MVDLSFSCFGADSKCSIILDCESLWPFDLLGQKEAHKGETSLMEMTQKFSLRIWKLKNKFKSCLQARIASPFSETIIILVWNSISLDFLLQLNFTNFTTHFRPPNSQTPFYSHWFLPFHSISISLHSFSIDNERNPEISNGTLYFSRISLFDFMRH